MTRIINIVGNTYDKYGSQNWVARYLMNGFIRSVTDFYNEINPNSVLEVGCGEGKLIDLLVSQSSNKPSMVMGCDLSLEYIAEDLDPVIRFQTASIYQLPFTNRQFDLVVCCEVLEHIEYPDVGLAELARVAKRAVLISTPSEPLWRIMNIARGKYLSEFGNTPGHIQHFSGAGLVKLVKQHITLIGLRRPIPWIVLLGKPGVKI